MQGLAHSCIGRRDHAISLPSAPLMGYDQAPAGGDKADKFPGASLGGHLSAARPGSRCLCAQEGALKGSASLLTARSSAKGVVP